MSKQTGGSAVISCMAGLAATTLFWRRWSAKHHSRTEMIAEWERVRKANEEALCHAAVVSAQIAETLREAKRIDRTAIRRLRRAGVVR